jgi:tetratricopeptide (TPR) repeat protein
MTTRLAVVIALVIGSVACASKTTAPSTSPLDPRYPEFVFPKAPAGTSVDVQRQLDSAWRILQLGDVKMADRGFAQLSVRHPDLYAAQTGLGYAALARKDYKAAFEHFDRAIALESRYAPALAGRGQAHLGLNEQARALENFDAALAADPTLAGIRSTADVLRLQVMQGGVGAARKAAQEGRLAEARAAYEQAILASPQSPFLFREIAAVEVRDGRLPAALAHARKAVELEPGDARNHIALADAHEALGELPQALDALNTAAGIEPGDALNRRISILRDVIAANALPEGLRSLPATLEITRAQLAALIAVRLADVVKRAPDRGATLATDVRDHWASEWILQITRARFMEVFPNHTFQPETIVRRGDLARAVSQVLTVISAGNPQLAARLRNARRRFTDVPTNHLRHAAASVAVEAGVLAPLEDGSFQLTRPVTGPEAVAAIEKLREIAGN